MAIIANDTQFIGIAPSIDLTGKKSAMLNAQTEPVTMADIVDTVESVLPSPANPTSGIYPINKNGVLVNSGLQNSTKTLPPYIPGGSLGLKFYDDFSSKTLLLLDPMNMGYTFGDAEFTAGTSVSASAGISILSPIGQMVMGCGISDPTNGVFRANSTTGYISIGTTPIRSIGVNAVFGSIFMGSGLANGTPSDSVTPVIWKRVVDESGNTYYSPLYQ